MAAQPLFTNAQDKPVENRLESKSDGQPEHPTVEARMSEIATRVKALEETDKEDHERLIRVEAKIDALIKSMDKSSS